MSYEHGDRLRRVEFTRFVDFGKDDLILHGWFHGDPSPPAMLDALAAAYRRDPAGVKLAFKGLGITPTGEAKFTSGEADEEK